MNRKRTLILLVILSLFLAALLSRRAALAWMALPFLSYLAAGLLAAPTRVSLRAARSLPCPRVPSGAPVLMTVMIENDGPALPLLRVDDFLDPKIHALEGQPRLSTALPAGGQADLRCTFRAARGLYQWETLRVTASDPFGLFETRLNLPAPAELRVLPARLPLDQLSLRPRDTLRTPGPNLSRLPGPGIDFYGVRAYHPGDSLRWIHWRLSARHPDQFFTREFEREEMADVGLIVDGSAAANQVGGSDELFERSVEAAAALARHLLRAGNRVSLLVLGRSLARVFPGAGKAQLARILDTLAACRPGEQASLNALKYLPVRLFPSRSTLILISPLRAGDCAAIARLRAGGYAVLLLSPDPVAFAVHGRKADLPVRAARLERAVLLWQVRELGVPVINWPVDQPLYQLAGTLRWMQR